MSKIGQMVEQQAAHHESHLKHIDELFSRARETQGAAGEPDPLLSALEAERDELAQLLHSIQHEPPETWQEAAEQRFGPMSVWQIMARLLENLVERAEHRR